MSDDNTLPPELRAVLDELKALEPLIYAANDGAERAHFEQLLVEDFWEVGASGQIYDRDVVLGVLEERQRHPYPQDWQTSGYRLRAIEAEHFLLTYTLQQPTRLSRRATLWRRTARGWQMVYHQGTVVA